MLRSITIVSVAALACSMASAQTTYNTSVSPGWYVGAGQPNANFVVNDNTAAGVQTGLSAFYRFDGGQNSVSGNTYGFNPGNTYPPSSTASWNFNYHANLNTTGSSGLNLGNTTILLTVDWDPTAGTNMQTYNLTAAYIGALGSSGTLLQDSQNLGFSFWGQPFDCNATGTYTFNLSILDGQGATLSSADMNVVVPAPGAAALMGLGGLAVFRRRRSV